VSFLLRQDGDSEPRTGAASGRRVVAVFDAAQRSLRNRGELEPVHLERRPTGGGGMKQYQLVYFAAIQDELGDELEAPVFEVSKAQMSRRW